MNEYRKKIIIYIVLFLILLGIIFGIVLFLKNKTSSTTTQQEPTNKNLFGYFTKNKPKNTSDTLSNGTTIINTDGTTISSNGTNANNQDTNSTSNGTSGQNGSGTGTNSGNGSGTGNTIGNGSGTGTANFTTGGGGTRLNNVTVDVKTGLPIDVKGPTSTTGSTGLPIGTTTGNCTVDPHGDLQYIVKEPQGDILFSEFGELISDGRIFPPDPFGVSVNAQSIWGNTKYKKIKKCIPAAVCSVGDIINYRVAQPEGNVLFTEDGELISDDRDFTNASPLSFKISDQGLWSNDKYRKIRQCIPQSSTNTTVSIPLDIGSNIVLDACKKLTTVAKPTDDEMRDCVLYRTWNVWTYPDNYIKDSRWDEENLDRAKFQSIKTKIRTEFNNITEKISSERSLSNTQYDLQSLIRQKQNLSVLEGDCKTIKLAIISQLPTKPSHDSIGKNLLSMVDKFKSPDIQNAIKDYTSSMLGTPVGEFQEINFINGTKKPLPTTLTFRDNSFPVLAFNDSAIRGLPIEFGEDTFLGKGTALSVYQRRQPQNVFELFTRDAGLSLFCKLTDASIGYTITGVSTWQSQSNRLYCDSLNEGWGGYTPSLQTPNGSVGKNNYDLNNHNLWYRATPSYMIYQLYKNI